MPIKKSKGIGRKLIKILLALIITAIIIVYSLMLHQIFKQRIDPKNDPLVASRFYQVLVCAAGDFSLPGLSYVCKPALTRISFNSKEIEQINERGDLGILSEFNKETASIMLPRLIEMGADINAIQIDIYPRGRQWTALHHSVYSPPWWAELLLKYNADTEKRDAAGRTPLDLAKELLAKKPDNADWAAIVQLLESHKSTK